MAVVIRIIKGGKFRRDEEDKGGGERFKGRMKYRFGSQFLGNRTDFNLDQMEFLLSYSKKHATARCETTYRLQKGSCQDAHKV